jgi:hypothetical protein
MADSKVSALTAVTTPADTDELPVNQGGVSKKVNLTQLTAYFEQRGRQTNASVANQSPTGATDTYIVGSDVTIPAGRLQAKSMYRLKFDIAKTTAAGAASVVLAVRLGTAGTTSDTARATLTFAVQTALADEGAVDLNVVFRTVGSGTTAVIQALGMLDHRLAATGLTTVNTSIQKATSGGFDSTVAGLRIGCSVILGSSTVATISLVQAELFNLA